MNPMAKERESGKNYYDAKHSSFSPRKGNTTKDGKKYLPASAFNKTVKSSTTKSLLKFRHRQEQQEFKKVQQYKSYQRVMRREGYDISKSSNNRKRHRDDTSNDECCDGEEVAKANVHSDEMKEEKSISERIHDSPDEQLILQGNEQKSATLNDKEISSDGSKKALISKGDDWQGKSKHLEKRNKKRNQHQEEQRRADEYKQRQIQMEREKKEKLKHRQERHRLLSARTSKGQPIMKNIALDILNKLQREEQQKEIGSSFKHH